MVSTSAQNRSLNYRGLNYKLALIAVLLAYTVVLLGAYTRLVDAGLGCPDWPGCYGFLSVPDSSHELEMASQAFPHSPVEADKAWSEMIHRYFAGSLGLLVAALTVLAFINNRSANNKSINNRSANYRSAVSRSAKNQTKNTQPLFLSYALLAIVIFQSALGMWTVTMGLLPIIVMGHLLGGFITLTLLLVLLLKIRHGNPIAWASPIRSLTLIAIIIVFLQIMLGGWTSANYAAIICADFPTCQGSLIPPLDFSGAFTFTTEGVNNYLGGHLGNDARVTIHWLHRLGALITTLFLCFLIIKLIITGWTKFALWIAAVLIVQIALGISNVIFSLPLVTAVAHNAVAALLLMSLATLLHYSGLKQTR